MRHLIPLVLSTVIVAGAAYAAVNVHHDYIHQVTVTDTKAAAAAVKAKVQAEVAAHKQAEATEVKIAKLEKACQQGVTAYNNLTSFAKAHAVKPDCSVQ